MTYLHHIGTALPRHRYAQKDLLAFMLEALEMPSDQQTKLSRLYEHSGIGFRHSVLSDFGQLGEKNISTASLSERMGHFSKEVVGLSVEAIQAAFEKSPFEANELTHLIAVTCTGLSAPGLDLMLMQALDLPRTLARTCVHYMGCYAAMHALKQAHAICQSDVNARVLVVCTELCTLHFQNDNSWDSLTSSLLFADGSAAALLSAQPSEAGVKLNGFYSQVALDGWDEMAWNLSETGFLMKLGSGVPQYLQEGIGPLLGAACQSHGLTLNDLKHWIIHPGGRKILDLLQAQLQLPPEALGHSRKILHDCGNMSSPTVLFVLKEALEKGLTGPAFMGAFGPGLTMETALLNA